MIFLFSKKIYSAARPPVAGSSSATGGQGGMSLMYYVYVLRSKKDNKFYTGITDNLERRIREHNQGKNFSTKDRGQFEQVYFEKVETRILAREREKYLKSGVGREHLKNLIQD